MSSFVRRFAAVLTLFALGSGNVALAQGRIAPRPPLPPIPPPLLQVPEARQPVRLVALDVQSRVVGTLARSTVEMTFHNPNARVLEGSLEFALLPGQEVTGFALDIDGMWRDAVPVEKTKGRAVFEDVIRQRIDPALLEHTQGNHFRMRVYPLPANGQRRVQISLTERMGVQADGRALMRLALPPVQIERFSMRLMAAALSANQAQITQGAGLDAGQWQAHEEGLQWTLQRQNWQPPQQMGFAFALPARAATVLEERDGQTFFYTEVPAPQAAAAQRPAAQRVALVWDASGSGAQRDQAREFALLDAWFAQQRNVDVRLQLARDVAQFGGQFAVRNGDWQALRDTLKTVAYDGASAAASLAVAQPVDAVLLFSDGLFNYGETALPRFAAPVLAANSAPGADLLRLGLLASHSGGALVDLTQTAPAQALNQWLRLAPQLLDAEGEGASDVQAGTPDAQGRLALAGRLNAAHATLRLRWRMADGSTQVQSLSVARAKALLGHAAQPWARLRVDALLADPARNQAQIRRLGQDFALLTPGTSLIVLDRLEDYVQHDITPPAPLREAWERMRAQQIAQTTRSQSEHLQEVQRRFDAYVAWWNKDFPKGRPPRPKAPPPTPSPLRAYGDASGAPMLARSPAPAMMAAAAPAATRNAPEAADGGNGQAGIALRQWAPDSPYARRLRAAPDAELYPIYLDERPSYTSSTAFFLDVADILIERGQRDLALRVLSNLAEMQLDSRHILRILGQRLQQLGETAPALHVLEQVWQMAPDEPQSWRDLGLARAAAGQPQQAVDALYEVVRRPWSRNFPDIELIALTELNALIDTTPAGRIDTSAIAPGLLRKLPLDLRVVLSWDADNSDMDLHVTDPNGEEVFYSQPLSYQGGMITRDVTGGYGPEAFMLKSAKPGTYTVQAKFYGHRQQIVAPATTLQLYLYTGFATPQQQVQSVTLRLSGAGEMVTVGTFEVGGGKARQKR